MLGVDTLKDSKEQRERIGFVFGDSTDERYICTQPGESAILILETSELMLCKLLCLQFRD